ncbi:type II secretion system F family protein [Enteractinococcus coprophilus]|uniref:Tight adherence protein C n=1 Tax=Enteractinococcus coprophilus TaxID=1027633 RepID=A0A542ZZX5_9MICC|nr:type II secretion system F family protein [Enteractinococcus coprophilus]TQL65885.1 tight adherence protein C [Enteractinococcus coprophilus]
MNAAMWSAIGLAIAGAVGLTMLIVTGIRFNKSSLAERVAPQMRGYMNAETTERATLPMFGTLSTISTPLVQAGVDQLNKLNLGNAQLTSRLAQAGSRLTVADYRAQQLMMAVGAAILAISGCIWAAVHHALNPIIGLIIVTIATVLAFFARDNLLTAQINRRRTKILAEFPTVAELLALSVAAGESAHSALERVATTARGELAYEFKLVLADIRSGDSLTSALNSCSDRLKLHPVERFITGLTVAHERGTPLAAVLYAQARDVRELTKRELLELAGKKEISMLVPLIFGILPLTVVFAVFPGLSLLNLGL